MNLDKDELLSKVKVLIEAELERNLYIRWIKDLGIQSIDDNKIILIVKSEEQKYNIVKRFYNLLQNSFKIVTGKMYKIEVIVKLEDKRK